MTELPSATPDWVLDLLSTFGGDLSEAIPLDGLYIHGSLPLNDFQEGRSDIDVVAVTPGPLSDVRAARSLHARITSADARAGMLHCAYVDRTTIGDSAQSHPAWAHSRWLSRPLSTFARLELLSIGTVVLGPSITEVIPAVDDPGLRAAIAADASGYWIPATRRRRIWLADIWVDIGLTSAVRAGASLDGRQVITKTTAIGRLAELDTPAWLVDDLANRRAGQETDRSAKFRLRRAHAARVEVRRLFGRVLDEARVGLQC